MCAQTHTCTIYNYPQEVRGYVLNVLLNIFIHKYVCVLRRHVWYHFYTSLKMYLFSHCRMQSMWDAGTFIFWRISYKTWIKILWGNPCLAAIQTYFHHVASILFGFNLPLPQLLALFFMEVKISLTRRQKWEAKWRILSRKFATILHHIVAQTNIRIKCRRQSLIMINSFQEYLL